jgi:integrase/recombinase XerD
MSDDHSKARVSIAEAFGTEVDPLSGYDEAFHELAVDPFEVFLEETLREREPAVATVEAYERLIGQWRAYMDETERHPACPNEAHVRGFVQHCIDSRENQPGTARTKLRRLSGILRAWQLDPAFPHEQGYDPFVRVIEASDLSREQPKEPPQLSVADLRRVIGDVTHLRDRLVIGLQLKLGLRASEVVNLCLSDIGIEESVLTQTYPEIGTHHALSDREDAVYIASRYERDGNKSHRPRLLPLDEELRELLRRYLLVRPTAETDALVLTKSTHNQIDGEDVSRIWRAAFRPEYAETETHRAVTSHFGRHRFTTHWRVAEDLPRPLVKYMRGDTPADDPFITTDAIDVYVHTYYDDIAAVYRERIYRLDLV